MNCFFRIMSVTCSAIKTLMLSARYAFNAIVIPGIKCIGIVKILDL